MTNINEIINELFNSIENNDLEKVQKIITAKTELLEQQLEEGATPLMQAATYGHFKIVKFLVDVGADVNKYDAYGSSSFTEAANNKHWDILNYLAPLTEQEFKETTLFIAISDGNIEAVNALISLKIDINIHTKGVWNEKGFTPLIIAVQEKETQIAKLLLEAGANPNLPEEDTGGTPLIYAAKTGSLEIINLLLKFGANPNIRDSYNENALMKAEKFGNRAIVEVLSKYS
ncbi:ankyrin repeat domain-containing protein [Oscillatoria salina]|uniref:ankyrin repeat domain-containing protein n=1 Tax=Oscillatoria salina TaxID=331517 RepID=UPI0013BDCB96|nr:ankyrin repeat domain-containing protein [Oscillatoria salina]MBZ8182457.1 hypothetical protein [Oscillatoria salina IIICB1]NET90702.1 hypothetical protein [Kamptonema sp. SIO1D9]